MIDGGYILLSRGILDSKLFSCSNATLKTAIYLLLSCNFKSGYFKRIEIKQGQIVRSINNICNDCNLSTKAVRHALKTLEADSFIKIDKPFGKRQGQRITICNYTQYQDKKKYRGAVGAQEGTQEGTHEGTQEGTRIEERKKNKKERSTTILSGKPDEEEKSYIPEIKKIVNFLNLKLKTNYKATGRSTQKIITTRLKEKNTVEDFKKVIRNKYNDWKGTDYEKFLRPETLFGNKFEGYLNQPTNTTNQLGESYNERSEEFYPDGRM